LSISNISPGFKHAGPPNLDGTLVTAIIPQLPAIIIILIIEHIAIAKSFGRIFNYTVITSQEMCAQGAANLFSPFVGGYTCTGSFGASAVLSKAGVRTPLAGLFSAFILILALYALTAVFYFIPMAALAGLIIHAVWNLATPPRALYKYWQLSPFELGIWVVGVIVALFSSLEISIYTTIGMSFLLVLLRIARTKGRFLGAITVHNIPSSNTATSSSRTYEAFLPLDRRDASNPSLHVQSPHPGVFIYRFSEAYSYINQALYMDSIRSYILSQTRRTTVDDTIDPRDRLWNDPGPAPTDEERQDTKPLLRAVVLDCSAMNNIDITAVQGLVDLKAALDRYAAPEKVEFHFAGVHNRWTRRALAVAGFGFPRYTEASEWSPMYSVVKGDEHADRPESGSQTRRHARISSITSEEDEVKEDVKAKGKKTDDVMNVFGVDRPLFHVDLIDAVDCAVRSARGKEERAQNARS